VSTKKPTEEFDDDEIELRPRVGIVITAAVLLLIIGYGLWRGLF